MLKHSVEVAHLAGIMAAELGVNVEVAKRAGLLHDIGKAVDHEIEGSPRGHRREPAAAGTRSTPTSSMPWSATTATCEPRSVEAHLVAAADAISAARPGARRETLETYIKRLEKLEALADSFDGVEKSYAIQAGREIRVMVKPEKIDDYAALKLDQGDREARSRTNWSTPARSGSWWSGRPVRWSTPAEARTFLHASDVIHERARTAPTLAKRCRRSVPRAAARSGTLASPVKEA